MTICIVGCLKRMENNYFRGIEFAKAYATPIRHSPRQPLIRKAVFPYQFRG